jgi:hypothetical protein
VQLLRLCQKEITAFYHREVYFQKIPLTHLDGVEIEIHSNLTLRLEMTENSI